MLLFCVCMSDCVSKFVCARVFALMSVYMRLNVFECVPARHAPICVFSVLMSLPVTAECSYTYMLVTWMLEDTPMYVIVF